MLRPANFRAWRSKKNPLRARKWGTPEVRRDKMLPGLYLYPPGTFVRKLKRRPGKDIYLGGGGQLCCSFLQEDLVNELHLGVGPVLLGDCIPGFPGKFPQREFKLTECKSYANGSVGLRYERVRGKTRR